MANSEQQIPDFNAFERYFTGEMPPVEQRALEGRILDEPLVGEAYQGFLWWRKQQSPAPGTDLRDRLRARTRKRHLLPLWGYGAAASVLLVILAYWLTGREPERATQPENVVVAVKPAEVPRQPLHPAPAKAAPPATQHPSQAAGAARRDPEVVSDQAVPGKPPISPPLPEQPRQLGRNLQDSTIADVPKSVKDEEAVVIGSVTHFKRSMPASVSTDILSAKAVPADGWDNYHAYLRKNSAFVSPDGPVKVTFVVNADGALSGITATGPRELQKEAIRIISSGPAWKPAINKGATIATIEEIRLRINPSN